MCAKQEEIWEEGSTKNIDIKIWEAKVKLNKAYKKMSHQPTLIKKHLYN